MCFNLSLFSEDNIFPYISKFLDHLSPCPVKAAEEHWLSFLSVAAVGCLLWVSPEVLWKDTPTESIYRKNILSPPPFHSTVLRLCNFFKSGLPTSSSAWAAVKKHHRLVSLSNRFTVGWQVQNPGAGWFGPGENSLPGLQMADFSLRPYIAFIFS